MSSRAVLILFLVLVGSGVHAADRLAVPDRDAQVEVFKALQERYAEDYKKFGNAAERALAERLLKRAMRQATDDEEAATPTERYVLLREAARMATEALEVELMMECTGRLSDLYEVDGVEVRLELLEKLERKLDRGDQNETMLRAYMEVIDEALARDDFKSIEAALGYTTAHIRRVNHDVLERQYEELEDKAKRLAREYAQLKSSREKLKKVPDDPVANLVMGDYYCFMKNEWERGLPHLAKCGDENLRALAEKELAAPAGVKAMLDLAQGYWKRAEGVPDKVAKAQVLRRSGHWYRQAWETMSRQERMADDGVRAHERLEKIMSALYKARGVELLPGEIPPGATLILTFGRGAVRRAGLHNTARVYDQGPYRIPPRYSFVSFGEGMAGQCAVLEEERRLEFEWEETGVIPREFTISFWYQRERRKVEEHESVPNAKLLSLRIHDAVTRDSWWMLEVADGNVRGIQPVTAEKPVYNEREGVFLFSFIDAEERRDIRRYRSDFWESDELKDTARASVGRLNDGDWHHIVLAHDGSETSIYMDGKRRGREKIKGFDGVRSGSIRLEHLGGDGKIDEFVIFGRALSSSEIDHLRDLGLHGKSLK